MVLHTSHAASFPSSSYWNDGPPALPSETKVRNETRGRKLFHIRPQCLFSSVVSTYRYNTVSFCKTKKMKLSLQSSMCTECQSRRLHLFCMYTCSPWASTLPNVRHFEGLKHLWIYIYIYLYIFSSTNKQLDSTVRSLTGKRQQQKLDEKEETEEGTRCGHRWETRGCWE